MPESIAITDQNTPARYSDAEVNGVLKLLALNGGNVVTTHEQLEHAGLPPVSRSSLTKWRDHSFRSRYFEIRREAADAVSEELAGRSLERAMQADEVQAKLLERMAGEVENIGPEALAGSIRSLAQSKASDVEKAQLLRDKPTEITEHRSVKELMGILNSVPNLIEGELVEDAEVVEDDE